MEAVSEYVAGEIIFRSAVPEHHRETGAACASIDVIKTRARASDLIMFTSLVRLVGCHFLLYQFKDILEGVDQCLCKPGRKIGLCPFQLEQLAFNLR
jgi:hypothetical protein